MKKKYDLSVIDNQYGEQICQEYLAGEYAYILAETYLGNKKDIRYIYSVLERHNIPKRTKGGIVDALFLVGIIMTAGLWLMLLIFGR